MEFGDRGHRVTVTGTESIIQRPIMLPCPLRGGEVAGKMAREVKNDSPHRRHLLEGKRVIGQFPLDRAMGGEVGLAVHGFRVTAGDRPGVKDIVHQHVGDYAHGGDAEQEGMKAVIRPM